MCFIASSVFAQKANVMWGELSKKETSFQGLVNCSNGNIVKLSYEEQGGGFLGGKKTVTPILTSYDSKFNELKENSFSAEEDGMRTNGFLKVKDKIYLQSSKYDKETKSTGYYAQAIDLNTLNPVGNTISFGSFEARSGGWFSSARESQVNFIQSRDSSKLLVFALTPYTKKENEKYYLAVYDEAMNKLWDKTVELPYEDKYVIMFDYFITNKGDVGVLFKHYDQEVKKESVKVDGARVPSYKTKLLIYNKNTTNPKEMIFDVDNKFVENVDLSTDASDNLTLFGTYKVKESGHLTGYFISSIDPVSQKITLKKMEQFPQALNELLDEDDQGLKKEKDPGPQIWFKFRESLIRDNKSEDFLLEFYKKTQVTVSDERGRSRTYYTYEFGDIIDINITQSGKSTFVRIPKMQYSTDFTMCSGYISMIYGNKLCLFYNDDKDNITRDLAKKPEACKKFGKSSFVMTILDDKGEFTREQLYSNDDMPVTTCTIYCNKLGKNKISLYAQKINALSRAKDMLGYLELK